jgi:L-alanine-DL-glutamate epimerase-like enolase superfamily enzyme
MELGGVPGIRLVSPDPRSPGERGPNGLFVEYFPDDTVFNFGWLVDHELEVRDGALVLPERPGPGVEFVEEAVGRFALAM